MDSCPSAATATTEHGDSGAVETGAPPSSHDAWELDEQLRHIERVLQPGRTGDRESQAAYREAFHRLDARHVEPSAWHLPLAGKSRRSAKPDRTQSHAVLGVFTWAVLSSGIMAFVCGGILLGWSIVSGRTELWDIGMPVALCGQIALLVGLILQLDRLWHDSRHAAAKLEDVDEQLHELKTTTTMLSTGHNSPGGAFYSHLAGGAGPQLLLSDLKSQLDLLAVKIMQQDG